MPLRAVSSIAFKLRVEVYRFTSAKTVETDTILADGISCHLFAAASAILNSEMSTISKSRLFS
jgi:hypothetical protein